MLRKYTLILFRVFIRKDIELYKILFHQVFYPTIISYVILVGVYITCFLKIGYPYVSKSYLVTGFLNI